MNAALALHQLRAELLVFRRTREAAFFIFVFPVLLLLLLGSFYDGEIEGEPAANYLLVGILGYGAANTAFGGLAIQLVIRREYGILKRVRSTPLPGWLYLACLLGSNLVVFAVQSLCVVVLAVVAYDADWPGRPVSLAGALLIGAACFTGLGVGAAALIRSAEAVAPAVNVIVLPMAFLSGSFFPLDSAPPWLRAISEVFPLKHLNNAMLDVMVRGRTPEAVLPELGILLGFAVVLTAISAKLFKWDSI